MRQRRHKPDDILHEYGINVPPIDVFSIAAWMGATVYLQRNIDYSGRLEVDEQKGIASIFVNREENLSRQRFTAAHELGHLLLHPFPRGQLIAFRDEDFSGNPQEIQANQFAADLLMPLWLLEESAWQYRRDANRLAEAYQVSISAMRERLLKLYGKYDAS